MLPLGVITLSVLAGCTVGPNYSAPETAAPPGWSSPLEGGEHPAPPGDLAQWWTTLNDPQLTSLVERALAGNLDLREAQARVLEARAQLGVVQGQNGPDVTGTSSYSRSRASRNAFVIPGGGGGSPGSDTGGPAASGTPFVLPGGSSGVDLYQVGFDAAWEIDVFGRQRRAVEAARADIGAATEAERGVLISLVSEVARNYVEVRSFQNRLTIAQNNVRVQQDALDLARARFQAGLTNELDVARADAQLSATGATIPTLQAGLAQAIHRLGVLLGRDPGAVQAELAPAAPIPDAPADIPVGLPSDLLRRRPDIRQAEREMAAANARIGVATADLFPRITLTGAAGFESTHFGSLPEGRSFFWSIGPGLNWSIFSMGRVQSNIRVQEAREQQAAARYNRTVLTAFEDAENALVNYGRELVRRRSLGESVAASRRAVDLATELYTRGLTDFLAVIDAQRQLFASQDALARSERDVAVNLIALYKALGGGWDDSAAPSQPDSGAAPAATPQPAPAPERQPAG